MSNYYISDFHIDHENVSRFDTSPFADLTGNTPRNCGVLGRRRNRQRHGVYPGIFFWATHSTWPFFMEPLAGQEVMIRDNHNLGNLPASAPSVP